MLAGQFSAGGFRVVADNALDLIVGAEAASAGYVGANIQQAAAGLRTDLRGIAQRINSEGAALRAINESGFANVERTLSADLNNLEDLSAISIAISAAGFAAVTSEVGKLRADLRNVATTFLEVQKLTTGVLVDIRRVMDDVAATGEKMLDTLLRSRTVEAQQLVRQGCDNLRAGYSAEAFERFTRSLEYDNTVFLTHSHLAQILAADGMLEKALSHCHRAVRFAGKDGPSMEATAHCQLSNVLEQSGRHIEAEAALGAAIKLMDRVEWRFHRAELLVACGSTANALAALQDVIESDARFFVAAMGSSAFSAMGRSFVSFLHRLDATRRASVANPLTQTAYLLATVEKLLTPNLPGIAKLSDALSELRQRGQTTLEKLLLAPFADLASLRVEVDALRDAAEALHAEVSKEVLNDLSRKALRLLSAPVPGVGLLAWAGLLVVLVVVAASACPLPHGGRVIGLSLPRLLCVIMIGSGPVLVAYCVLSAMRSRAEQRITRIRSRRAIGDEFDRVRGLLSRHADESAQKLAELRLQLSSATPGSATEVMPNHMSWSQFRLIALCAVLMCAAVAISVSAALNSTAFDHVESLERALEDELSSIDPCDIPDDANRTMVGQRVNELVERARAKCEARQHEPEAAPPSAVTPPKLGPCGDLDGYHVCAEGVRRRSSLAGTGTESDAIFLLVHVSVSGRQATPSMFTVIEHTGDTRIFQTDVQDLAKTAGVRTLSMNVQSGWIAFVIAKSAVNLRLGFTSGGDAIDVEIPSPGACAFSGLRGICLEESQCENASFPNLCDGASNIRCCIR